MVEGPKTPLEIQLWKIALPPSKAQLALARQCLPVSERQRIDAIKHAGKRAEQIMSGAALRLALSGLLTVPAETISFELTGRGKPVLAEPFAGSGIQFNLSHVADSILIAATAGARIGVDLETPRALPRWQSIAQRYFSAAEQSAIEALPTQERLTAFYNCWVRKEALVKATGGGIASGLASFDVNVSPTDAPRLLASRNPELSVVDWTLHSLDLGPDRIACLAVESRRTIQLDRAATLFPEL